MHKPRNTVFFKVKNANFSYKLYTFILKWRLKFGYYMNYNFLQALESNELCLSIKMAAHTTSTSVCFINFTALCAFAPVSTAMEIGVIKKKILLTLCQKAQCKFKEKLYSVCNKKK